MKELEFDSWARAGHPSVSLRDIAAPLFRRKRTAIITFLVVLGLGVIAALLSPPEYTSHMAILVNQERLDPLVSPNATTQTVNAGTPVSEEEMHSEAEMLKSRDVLEKVVLATGLENQSSHRLLGHLRSQPTQADRVESAVQALAKHLNVEAVDKSNLIEINYSSTNPQRSYGVLKDLSELYMDKRIALHRTPGAYQFFAAEADKYHQALSAAEDQLKNFATEDGAEAPDLERASLAEQVTSAIGEEHRTQEAMVADAERLLNDGLQMRAVPQRSSTQQSTSPADRLLETLRATLLTAQLKRDQLAVKFAPDYPLLQEANQEVADTRAAIAEAEQTRYTTQTTDRDPTFELLREDRARTEADLAAKRAELKATKESVQSLQTDIVNLDQKSITQQDLLRNVKADETNYLLYLSKREQERTADALDRSRIANVELAVPPEIPALPSHGLSFLLLLAFAAAPVIAIATAYLVDYFDPSFHTPAQVMSILDIPVVVAVPKEAA